MHYQTFRHLPTFPPPLDCRGQGCSGGEQRWLSSLSQPGSPQRRAGVSGTSEYPFFLSWWTRFNEKMPI